MDKVQGKVLSAYRKLRLQEKEITAKKNALQKEILSREWFNDAVVEDHKITKVVTTRFALRDDIEQEILMDLYPEAVDKSINIDKIDADEQLALMGKYPEAVEKRINIDALKEIPDAHGNFVEKETVSIRFTKQKDKE